MCTVTFVRSGTRSIITSNRDEQAVRQAIAPKAYLLNNKTIIFPKDPKAGGTWYAVDDHANVLVLLNGAEEKHRWNPPYRKSRGLIVLDLISSAAPFSEWEKIDLSNIEPFTIVLYGNERLAQLRWNGIEKNTLELDPKENYIWSSTMLYPKDVREQRATWFDEFIASNPAPTPADMYGFHRYTGHEDLEFGLVINRNNVLQTVSITQTVIEDNNVSIVHHDLISDEEFPNSFQTG
jgi:uncharacterized protein with NRDE domain